MLTLHEPKQPSALKLCGMSHAHVVLDLLRAQGAPNRIPRDGNHTNHGGEHATSHREDALRVPPVVLQEGPGRQARQVRCRRMTRRVPRREQVLRKALLCERGGRRQHGLCALLHFCRCLDKSHCKAGFKMPLDVAVE